MFMLVVLRLLAAMWFGGALHQPVSPNAAVASVYDAERIYVEDTIYWHPDHRLTWDDFRGKPNRGGYTVALTSSGIGMAYRSDRSGTPVIEVYCFFYCKNSWVKDDGRTDYILKHEQMHFDITELYARKLRQRIEQMPVKTRTWPAVQKLYTQINRECDARQTRYDGETHHGIDQIKQAEWNKAIERELEQSAAYASRGI